MANNEINPTIPLSEYEVIHPDRPGQAIAMGQYSFRSVFQEAWTTISERPTTCANQAEESR